jgi:hypothetical protein
MNSRTESTTFYVQNILVSVSAPLSTHYFYKTHLMLSSKRGPFLFEYEWVLSQLNFQCTALENPPMHGHDGETMMTPRNGWSS